MNNENMVRIYNRTALTCKEKEIMKIADKQMELKKVILHNTDLERQTPYILSYLWILDVNLSINTYSLKQMQNPRKYKGPLRWTE